MWVRKRESNLPKQNRPVVKDGRIQPPKKRTDRSYLGAGPAVSDPGSSDVPVVDIADAVAMSSDPATAFAAPAPAATKETSVAKPPMRAPAPVPAVGAARALQQQGVQKRRGIDLNALARRDTSYALHELRRIGVLTAMVITTLVVLGVVLR